MKKLRVTMRSIREGGFGLIESLVAVAVTGVVCTALIQVAVLVIRESKNNELRDTMSQYASEGFERARTIATTIPDGYDSIPCTVSETYGYLDSASGVIVPVPVPSDLCSQTGSDGDCEKLPLIHGGSDDMFYREFTITKAGSPPSCDMLRITCRVGMLSENASDYPRNFVTNTEIVGYVVRP